MDAYKVSCLCPTYARFSFLRQSLACFLAQDWPEKELVILNDHPTPIRCDIENVRVVNAPRRFPGLSWKKQALLELAEGRFVANWEDDDFYLPWHLSHWLPVFVIMNNAEILHIRTAYRSRGVAEKFRIHDMRTVQSPLPHGFESQMFYRTEAVRKVGYPPRWVKPDKWLLDHFHRRGQVCDVDGPPWASMIWRLGPESPHLGYSRTTEQWGAKSNWEATGRLLDEAGDCPDGPLTPADIRPQLRAWKRFAEEHALGVPAQFGMIREELR